MELRERIRAGMWSGPKISTQKKKEKIEEKTEWVEMLEEKMMEGMDRQSKKLMKKFK